ncbi:flagellar protein FlgN [Marinobacterium sediminicola]|uniref:Flagellar biosynthesis/type III secretory pathway chaperone n=1 Tax=Marinobacterium sediminicola TaxID=518898 RepID=A0ABY1RYE5_9GAMM|nr:flagellar protein FlgN [Marinobacterium sediminicola]ULG68807.1 flagellar protein FlgN [Marinobacterium sediminicola]SMR73337.1 Flagellar biosynthesis/type III secretory pathway chaperone [Marinobacterium sediminicola]
MTAPLSPEITNQLGGLIVQGIKLLQQLQELLETELDALKSRDLEALEQSNRDKHECLLAFDRSIRERNALLDQLQIGHDRDSVLALIAQAPQPDSGRLNNGWHKLESALEKVKLLNQRNEQVLVRNKQNADQLLALLQGHAKGNTIYDQRGDKGRYEGQRSLGKA